METASRWRSGLYVWTPYRVAVPVIAGVVLLLASLLPWFNMPLQKPLSGWQLPVDLGWQFHIPGFSYGILCALSAFYAFFMAYQVIRAIHAENGQRSVADYHPLCISIALAQRRLVVCCFLFVAFFLWQYLLVDMGSMAELSRQEVQYLLISREFGYGVGAQLFPIADPVSLDIYTLPARFVLLINQLGISPFLPLVVALILLSTRHLLPVTTDFVVKRRRSLFACLALVVVCLLFMRSIMALVCVHQAEYDLSTGANASALTWLDRAHTLNPSLDQLPSYHVERGQALYYLYPGNTSPESHFYLARNYSRRHDYLESYQELTLAWENGGQAAWYADEFTGTLDRLALLSKPLVGQPYARLNNDNSALPWIQQLLRMDPGNVSGYYLLGRIQYDSYNYSACDATMQKVIDMNRRPEVLSSAYTYIALCRIGRGKIVDGRALLLQAVKLDPEYRNNTAREELSGLR